MGYDITNQFRMICVSRAPLNGNQMMGKIMIHRRISGYPIFRQTHRANNGGSYG